MSPLPSQHEELPGHRANTLAPRREGSRLPELDGLRALSVTAVVATHAGVRFFHAGGIGVDVFFVLSGYLITHLLLREWDLRGRIDIPRFYARRALRLLPALYLLLITVVLISSARSDAILAHANRVGAAWSVVYLNNWPSAWLGWLAHLWSLAVEEQFYVVWPIVLTVALLCGASRRAMAWTLGLAAVADLIYMVAAYHGGWYPIARIANGTDTHAHGLLAGCAIALAVTRNGVVRIPRRVGLLTTVSLPATIGLAAVVVYASSLSRIFYVAYPVGVPCAVVLVATLAIAPPGWSRILATPPLVYLGRISYSLYLWHFPVLGLVDATPWTTEHAMWKWIIIATVPLALAASSYHIVEMPFLRRKARVTVLANQERVV